VGVADVTLAVTLYAFGSSSFSLRIDQTGRRQRQTTTTKGRSVTGSVTVGSI
jgi:hypothetical protein